MPTLSYLDRLDEYFDYIEEFRKIQWSSSYTKRDERLLFKEYIMSDENGSLHIHKQSQFDIHSISKLMAKAAIYDLEKKSRISTSDLVSNYIDDFPNGDKMTIQHLMDNQSGLPRGFEEDIPNLITKKSRRSH